MVGKAHGSEGTVVASELWTSLVHRVVAKQLATRAAKDKAAGLTQAAPTRELTGTPVDRRGAHAGPAGGGPAADDRDRLRGGSAPRLRFPGEYLKPRLVPTLRPVHVVVVNTDPVSLDVTIDRLPTLDGFDIERTTIRVVVQLVDDERYAWLADLAAEYGPGLEAHLLDRVRVELVTGVQSAVKMNRLADIRRLTLQEVLADRWLPASFAGGSLVRRDFTVLGTVWPAEPVAADTGHTGAPRDG